jgi:hypothetical protein
MANVFFTRKLAADALYDTLFFSTRETILKTKTREETTLSVPGTTVVIYSNRNIRINGKKLKSIHEAQYELQRTLC